MTEDPQYGCCRGACRTADGSMSAHPSRCRKMRLRSCLLVLVLTSVATALSGCGATAFSADESIRITSPAPLTKVSIPFDVSWTVASTRDRSFAVFVDRSPIAAGHSLRDLASDQCKRQRGCPDAAYLAGLGVYLTTTDHVTVQALLQLAGTAG